MDKIKDKTQRVRPVQLPLTHKPNAVDLLTRAFHDDPGSVFLEPEETDRPAAMHWIWGRVVQYCLLYRYVYTDSSVNGIACGLPPAYVDLTAWRLFRSKLFMAPFSLSWPVFRRFQMYMSTIEHLRKQYAPHCYWYLTAMAVEPACQGQGVGSQLLTTVLRQAESHNTACYLETTRYSNIHFYETHGFEVVASEQLADNELTIWALVHPD